MAKVTILAQAEEELDQIWLWLAIHAGRDLANRKIRKITARMLDLGPSPMLGPARTDIDPDVRQLRCERWIIFYRICADEVQVVHILDEAQDQGSRSF